MANKSRVLWKDGLSVKPQHFQQQQRNVDYILNAKIATSCYYAYGLNRLVIDQDLLKLGRIGLTEASGSMPDGTYFDIPFQDKAPDPIEIKQLTNTNKDIYLALPISNDAIGEVDSAQESNTTLSRYTKTTINVLDLHTRGGGFTQIETGQLAPKLIQGSDNLSAYTVIPLCRIREQKSDKTIVLDDVFIPTISNVVASPYLHKFMIELANLVLERAKHLSAKIGSPTQSGVTGISEFLMLQLLNRNQPLYLHLTHSLHVHPADFYRQLSQTCGELMTFTAESKTPPIFPIYNHDNLTESFQHLIRLTRQALSIVLTPRAVPIPLVDQSDGVKVGMVHDKELLKSAEFILAVKAQTPQEQLTRLFMHQTKISSPARLQELVHVQIPGVPLTPLTAAPPQLPFHAGYSYFRLETASPEWSEILDTNSIAFHVSGTFPNLDMQLWALRSK